MVGDENIRQIKRKIDRDRNIVDYSYDELVYLQKPIGRAIYASAPVVAVEKNKKNWYDKIECDICGKTYTRSAKSKHVNTQYHQIYANLNKKLCKILVN